MSMNLELVTLQGVYHAPLVVLSIVLAIVAAGVAIDLSGRVTFSRGQARLAWLTGGAVAMGVGIWSMHYIGMLAYKLPVAVQYHWPIVLLSLLAAAAASWVSLYVVSRESVSSRHLVSGSILMGSGIAAMHYIGMYAMRMPAMHHYSSGRVALSIALAIAIAYVALRLTFTLRATMTWNWRKVASSVLMGSAIPVMHYVGMSAVSFTAMPEHAVDYRHAVAISDLSILAISLITLLILGLALLTAMIDRRFASQAGKLESSEQRYQMIVETASDAFLEIALDGRVVGCNAHAEQLFGWSRADVLRKAFDQLLVSTAEEPLHSQLEAIASTHRALCIEVMGHRRDGSMFPAEMTLSAVHLGHSRSFAAFVRDVTQRKLAEAEREKAKTAAEAGSRAKSEFLANMSHEIRTPLNGVIGMAELMLDTTLSAVQREYASTIRDSSKALLAIINDILDFSKVEAGKLELEHLNMDIRDVFEDCRRLLAIQADEKELSLTAHIDPRLPLLVNGDAGRLRQVLLNLGGNAVKFTRRGEVALNLQLVETGAHGTRVRCEVRDTGIGIATERLDALFSPFTQADSSTTRKYGGTGLGLSIVRRLVELMDGETGVTSMLGRGSTFWFTATFAPPTQNTADTGLHSHTPWQRSVLTAAAQGAQARSARVLLAEDNLINQKVASRLLENLGCQVDVVGDGASAVRAWQSGNYDIVLMDCQMPELDGYEAARAIRRLESARGHERRPVRIVALTADAMMGTEANCLAAGMNRFLTKPIDRNLLASTLAELTLELRNDSKEGGHADSALGSAPEA